MKKIVIILSSILCVLLFVTFVVLPMINIKDKIDVTNQALESLNQSIVENYIVQIDLCLSLDAIDQKEIPNTINDKEYCSDKIRLDKDKLESIELTTINDSGYYSVDTGTIVYDGVTYHYNGANKIVEK